MSPLFFFLLLLLSLSVHYSTADDSASPPKCRNYQQACAIELRKFSRLVKEEPTAKTTVEGPSIEETTTTATAATSAMGGEIMGGALDEEVQLEPEEEEGSGMGAAADNIHFVPIGISFPMYDEFVPTTPIYDYGAEPAEKAEQQICACPDEETCDFGSMDRVVSFNHQIRAAFCKPLDEIFKLKCKGTRTLARVIGTLEKEPDDGLSAVNDTLVFCRCDSDVWARVMVEPWLNNAFAFSYKCLSR